ncbi:growth-regulating factor 9 isoform X1 [Prunus yedoensis var. nudiflora]|uniref:Growth-regulating factor n=1 Tax=Prunus yedoensis var. nudiflora TaxID=2094558 RepID=A0A314UYN2_PRUYE|nr:growth-regulating factor 9 isoform X1 [Prunus yedoensis var. nudiflora]
MRISKTEVNLRRLLAAAPLQQNQAKLVHYVATLREQVEQLAEERTPEGLPRVSKAVLSDYSEKIEAIASKLAALPPDIQAPKEPLARISVKANSSDTGDNQIPPSPGLRRRFGLTSNSEDGTHEILSVDSSVPVKLDAAAQAHIEKHRKLQEDLTDEMVGLARQLKESSLMMNHSLQDAEKILDSTEKAVESSLASTGHANTRATNIYSKTSKTTCFTWLVKLGLGIGVDCYGDDRNGTEEVVVGKKKKKYGGGLTASQLHELEQQALIYKHFAANLPVPFHLVLPIWKSVAASFGSSNAAAIYRQYPSFVGFSALGFDYRDHEPGRCRRTDGKKWRCNKNVVPDQKYCQQHMHRGRQRSRKPVENSELASPSSTKTPKNSEGEFQISTPKGLQLMAQSYNYVSVSQGTTMASSGYHECKKNIRPVTTTSIANIPANRSATTTPAAVAATTIAGPATATNSSTNENSLNIGVKYNSSNHAGGNCMIRGSSMNVVNISPGLGFSPKSVLQALLGCNGLYFDNGSGVELEPGRCRRTDGKKWRCRRDVLPDQKYCGQHIHRGKEANERLPTCCCSFFFSCCHEYSSALSDNSHMQKN